MRDRLRAALGDIVGGGLVLMALAGLAITQPVLDLFGRNPTFFVAGGYNRRQIVAFAVVIGLVPALVGIAVFGVVTLLHRGAGRVVWYVVAGAFAAGFGLVLARSLDIDGTFSAFALAGVVAVAIVFLERRTRAGQLLLRYLAAGNLVFLALFFFSSDTAPLLRGDDGGDLGHVSVLELDGPVIVFILDELPLTTIMRPDGTINSDRYPNFARLARESTWFRNASSLNAITNLAVPSILTGTAVKSGTIPAYVDHPRNLLSLLGRAVPTRIYEVITEMCPPSICEPPPPGPLSQALEDAAVVYGHRVLPADQRQDLPQIGASWGNFAEDLGADDTAIATETTVKLERDQPQGPAGDDNAEWQRDVLRRSHQGRQIAAVVAQGQRITSEPAVHLVHVEAPHKRWTASPWLYLNHTLIEHPVKIPPHEVTPFEARAYHQLHSMQVGAVDRAIGDVIDHMKQVGAWDDALLVVTSDHGDSTTPPDMWRVVTERNKEETLRIPLFIKAPGQKDGRVVDAPALTVDVLPSIVDLLDIDTSWEFDGHSLFDGSKATVAPRVDPDVQAAFDAAAVHARQFAGWDWMGLAAVDPFKDLVGDQVAEHRVGSASALRVQLDELDLFPNLPTPEGKMPYTLTGTIAADERPPDLVVAVNGRLAGVLGGYEREGGSWKLLATVTDVYREGANTLAVYEVERSGNGVVLHEVSLVA